MKFKNSYILLIAMAVLLLVSIGSVCASENATNSDNHLASADTDDVHTDIVSAGEDATQNKINTTITADSDKEKFTYNDEKNITVSVKDNNTNEISGITKNNLTVFEGANAINFTYSNSKITIIDKLAVGNHSLIINYLGNNNYTNSSTTVLLKIGGNQTINPSAIANIDENNNVNIVLNLSDGVDPIPINKNNLTLVLFYKKNNQTLNKTFSPDEITINGQIIKIKVIEEFESAYIDIRYAAENNLTGRTNLKVNTKINIPVDEMQKTENETINFTATVTADNGVPLNITTDNLKVLNGATELKITYNNSMITIKDKLPIGVYNLTVKYIGEGVYSEASKNIIIKILGIKVNTTSININSTKKGEIKLNITDGKTTYDFTKNDIELIVSYKDGNTTKTIPVSYSVVDNKIRFELDNINFTTATLSITYNKTMTVNITLTKQSNVKVEVINNVAEYQSGNFTFRLTDSDTNQPLVNRSIGLEYQIKSPQITFQQTIHAVTDENGIVVFKNSDIYISYFNLAFNVGNQTVTLTQSGIRFDKPTQTVIIEKANINIQIDKYEEYYGSDKKVKITVTNAKTGEPLKTEVIRLYMKESSSKEYYFQTSENGTSEISVTGLVGGTYHITVSNNNTNDINSKSVDGTIVIKKLPVSLSVTTSTIYYNSGTTAKIKVTRNGKALEGAYVLVKLYTSSTKYQNLLFQTNKNGEIKFSASLNVGKHKMVVSMADNRYEASSVTKTVTIKKASGKLTAKKLNIYYKGGKPLTIKLTNTKNKKAIYNAKVNVKIFISKNRYYNYNGKTAVNGQLKLLLDTLKPGKYKVVISGADSKNYKAKKITTKVVIKKAPTKLIPKKLTAKKGAKAYFKVTAKNKKTKKVIAKLKLKAKVYTGKKSKTYSIKTNSKGIAKLSVKKLKVGKHKVIVSSANKYCVAKKAKSTIKIKK